MWPVIVSRASGAMPARHLRIDEARSHGVDRDLARRDLAGQRLGEADETRFGGAVVRLPRVPHQGDDGADVHDPAVARPDHRGKDRPGHLVRPAKIELHDPIPLIALHPHQEVVAVTPALFTR